MEKSKRKKTDIKAELLRIIACLMVILIHIRLAPVLNGTVIKTPIFIGSFLTPAVGIFFLVTGFFLYDGNKSIWQVVKRFLLKILMPTLLTVFLTLVFNNWLMTQSSLIECVRTADYPTILKSAANGILYLSSDYWGLLCAHLWYIAEYGKLLLFFPAAVILVRYASTKVLLYLAGLNVVFCFLIDLFNLFGRFPFPFIEPLLRPSQALVIIGCVLYRFREKLKERKLICPAMLAAYIGSSLWTFYAQYTQFQMNGGTWADAYFTTWLSGLGMVSSIALTAFIITLPDNWSIWSFIERPVTFLGSLSFPIYLIQYAVIIKLSTSGISHYFTAAAVTPIKTVCYYLIYGFFIFVISAAIAFASRCLFGLLVNKKK